MNNKEAIFVLKKELDGIPSDIDKSAFEKAVDLAIKALEARPTGHWFLLDKCSNEGVYCSNCHKKVYRVEYANQKVKSNYCPNCGADMRKETEK